jgi:cytochrome c oxidase subunit 2
MKMWRSLFALTACSTAGPSLAQVTNMKVAPVSISVNLHNGVTPIAQTLPGCIDDADHLYHHLYWRVRCDVLFHHPHRKSKGAIAARFHEHLGVK